MPSVVGLPEIAQSRFPPASVGPFMPPTTRLREEVRQALSPGLLGVLDGLAAQIQTQTLDPLLFAGSREELAKTFQRAYPKFRDQYLSMTLALWAAVEEDPQRFSAVVIPAFEESRDILRGRGRRYLGQDATLAALMGLDTIMRVSRATTKLLEQEKIEAVQLDEKSAQEWATWIIAYFMAASGVLSSLAVGEQLRGKRENVGQLAYWSKDYAVKVYHITKEIGLLQTPPHSGLLHQASDEEDFLLAEAGLDDYREFLLKDEKE